MRFRRTNMIAYLHDASTLNKSASQTEKLGRELCVKERCMEEILETNNYIY